MADSVLKYTIEGITNIVCNRGTINIDFNDLKSTISNKGIGHLGIGTVDSDGSILEAVKQAINSPLLETSIKGAENILLNTSGRINLLELNEAIRYVQEIVGQSAKIIWGTVTDSNQTEDKIVVTLIVTGMPQASTKAILPKMNPFTNIPTQSTQAVPGNNFILEETFPTLKPVTPMKSNVKEKTIVIPPFLSEKGVR